MRKGDLVIASEQEYDIDTIIFLEQCGFDYPKPGKAYTIAKVIDFDYLELEEIKNPEYHGKEITWLREDFIKVPCPQTIYIDWTYRPVNFKNPK